MIENRKVSVVTGCRNRESFLLQTLPTWLATGVIDEVVVVDWSSSRSLAEVLLPFLDRYPQLVLATVRDQQRWHGTKAYNLGVQLASGEVLLRLDSDVVLEDSKFFEHNPIKSGQFRAEIDLNLHPFPLGLWGTLLAFHSDVLRVNGYNERLVGYGWEDIDLFLRLSRFGRSREFLVYDHLRHLDHGTDERRGDQVETLEESMARNYESMNSRPWTMNDRRTTWKIIRDVFRPNLITCIELT